MSTAVEDEITDGTSSSSSTSSALKSGAAPVRKRNRPITISDKYSQLIEYEAAPVEF